MGKVLNKLLLFILVFTMMLISACGGLTTTEDSKEETERANEAEVEETEVATTDSEIKAEVEDTDETSARVEVTENGTLLEYFQNPDNDSRPMVRMWFPDAGAGEDDTDTIEKQIQELADKGFGGVEVSMLADGVEFNNEEGRVYGWGTDNWTKLLKKIFNASEKIENGFQVDITVSAHWPPAFNTIDPNDEAASKELSYSITKLANDLNSDSQVDIALPEQKTQGTMGPFDRAPKYPGFLFTATLVDAAIVQVSDVEVTTDEETEEEIVTPVFDFTTLQQITNSIRVKEDGGYAAGVPDKETAEEYGWDYDEVIEAFGPEPDGELLNNNGKSDENYNRARMADWQNEYVLDLSAVELPELSNSDGEELVAGDWVFLSTFSRGTGQAVGSGNTMHNIIFVTNYYNETGTIEITKYWEKMFEDDPELLELMKANPGNFFEDSIEASSAAPYWASTLKEDAKDYEYSDIISLIAAGKFTGSGFGGPALTEFFKFTNDEGLSSRIYEDYNTLLADSYVNYRVKGMKNWANENLNWGFRAQTYHLPGLEISKAASEVDVLECDNMAKGDGIRYQAGTRNVIGHDFFTMEAITGVMQEFVTMDDIMTELGQNYSDGVNRAILHGSPYSKSFNGFNSEWPGWLAFGPSSFGSSYTYRAPFWDDITTETSWMARIQSILQNGKAQIDLAVMIDKESSFDFESGNRFQNLLDKGYSYNLISESTISGENAIVEDGKLVPKGPAFKALILDQITTFDLKSMDNIIAYAENGLPIIDYGSDIKKVYGSDVNSDAVLQKKYAELLEMDNVVQVNNVEEIEAALVDLDVLSYVQYDTDQLEATMYTDPADGSNFYYLFNNAYPENSHMMGNDQASFYKDEDKILEDVEITLTGSGIPYKLDPYTGFIEEVAEYTDNGDGTVSTKISKISGGETMIYCLTETTDQLPADVAKGKVKTINEDLKAIDLTEDDWNLTIHSYGPGEDKTDPSISKITYVDFDNQKLGKWADLPATAEQLNTLGVSDMQYVSGIGEYTTAFDLPEGWDPTSVGAFLDVKYGKDQIGRITINGTELTANNTTDRVDLGGHLVEGENTLTIKLSTTLYAKMFVENSGYKEKDFGMGSGFMQPPEEGLFYNGLTEATLTPYSVK